MLLNKNYQELAWNRHEVAEGFDGVVGSPLEFVSKFARAVLATGNALATDSHLCIVLGDVTEDTTSDSAEYMVYFRVRMWHPDVIEAMQELMYQYLNYVGDDIENIKYGTLKMHTWKSDSDLFKDAKKFDEGYIDMFVSYTGEAKCVPEGYFTDGLEQLKERMKYYEFD